MTEADKRAYIIADNKHAQNAGWDEEMLAGELQELIEIDPAFDCDVLGFSPSEMDCLIDGLLPEEPGNPQDDHIPEHKGPGRCQVGDIWQLGDNRLVCGNMLDKKVAGALMGSEKARIVFTDPPYNVKINGHVGGLGKTKHREFEMASGDPWYYAKDEAVKIGEVGTCFAANAEGART